MLFGTPGKEFAVRARLVIFVVAAAFVVIANAGPSTATPIIVGYSGVIDTVDGDGTFLPGVVPGTTFSGTYTLDPDLFTTPGSPFPIFTHTPGPGSVEVDIGGNLFSQDVYSVAIGDDLLGPSGFFWDFYAFPGIVLPYGTAVVLDFWDSTGTRITDRTSFFVNTSLDGWDFSEMVLRVRDELYGPSRRLTSGTIMEVFVIPEPSTALLVGLGPAALGLRHRVR
jgi:hypothetical protein